MSGPKLVGITCDPVVIERNRRRLQMVGKVVYYKELFADVNTDITNEEKWILDYAVSTISRVSEDYGDPAGIIKAMDALKKRHIRKAETEKIDFSIINKLTVEELEKLGVQKVESIPKWKEDFVREASILLKKLQKDIEERQLEVIRIEKVSAAFKAGMDKKIAQTEKILEDMDKVEVTKLNIIRNSGEGVAFAPKEKKAVDPDTLPYSLEELALLEMYQGDLMEFEKCSYLGQEEKKILRNLFENMELISENNDTYSMKNKRNLFYAVKVDYQRLSKSVAKLTAKRNEEQKRRRTLELEYISFIKALDRMEGNYRSWSVEVLEEKVDKLRKEVQKQEERIYVEESMEEIMAEYGYTGISSHNLHNAVERSDILFEDKAGKKISTYFDDGVVLMHVVGEGKHEPTKEEAKKQFEEQTAFCEMYPEIRRELEERGIHIQTENLIPASEQHAVNIEIDRQQDFKKTTKKFSFRHVPLVSQAAGDDEMYDIAEPNVKQMDVEDL